MPKFTVEHHTALPVEETFKRVSDYVQKSEGLKNLDKDFKCELNPGAKSGVIKSSKFECDFNIKQTDKTLVTFNVSLPLLLSPFKGMVEKTLKEKMAKILG
jgi:hypothetical protein